MNLARALLLLGLLAAREGSAACPAPTTPWAGTVAALIEAETGQRSGATLLVTNDPNDTGDSVEFTANGNANDTCGSSGCLSLTFTAMVSGQYKFEARVLAPNTNANSYYFTLLQGGGALNDDCGDDVSRHSQPNLAAYQWVYVTDDDQNNYNDIAGNARVWTLTGGSLYTLQFKSREDGLRLDQVRVRQLSNATPTPTPVPAPGTGTGLCGEYYNNLGVSGTAALSRTDALIDFNWPSSPAPGPVSADNFSARWQGQIEAPASENYSFSAYADDGVRLWIDGSLVLDSWTVKAGPLTVTASSGVFMAANTRHNVVLEYNSYPGLARITLLWSSSSISPAAVVPSARLYPCLAGTATPTWTPSRTPTPPPSYHQGLSRRARLYDLEYVPFPALSAGANTIHDLATTFTSAAANAVPKNTARWRIELQGLASTVGNLVQVETRLGPGGEDCVSGYFDPNDYSAATSLSLPLDPQNLSTTYFWLSPSAVPLTERFDALGDPRFVPYLDVLDAPGGQAYAGGYNWFFRDLSTDASGAVYRAFASSADYNLYHAKTNADVPKLMALWRTAILASRSIFTSMTGWSNYYFGLGGEIGGDNNNQLNGGVPCYEGPWNGSGTSDKDEIIGDVRLVRSSSWVSRPYLGELWPDSAYVSDWSEAGPMAAWGNLRNPQQGGTAYRDLWSNAGTAAFPFLTQEHRIDSWGCATFMNAGGGGTPFNHVSNNGASGAIQPDAATMSQDYHFSSPASFPAWRPWGLAAGGNTPTEWTLAPYSGSRPSLDLYQEFYDSSTGGANRASAAIRSVLGSTAGFIIVNGLSPSTDTGINFTARFAILTCLRTFHEAGVPTAAAQAIPAPTKNVVSGAAYRIEPVPLVEITDPVIGKETRGQSVIPIHWTERYARWDGQRYTSDYPCLDIDAPPCAAARPASPGDPSLEWHSSEPLGYNLKYSPDGGSSWYSLLSGLTCSAGEMLDGSDMIDAQAGTHRYSHSWDVSALTEGTKLLRVECYRKDLPQHYGYHELPVQVQAP